MKIRLLKKWEWVRKTFYVGTILEVAPGLGKHLIEERTAEEYNGEYPPKRKQNMNFFKPK